MKVLIDKRGRKALVEEGEYHSHKGIVKVTRSTGPTRSHLGHEFFVLEPDTIDLYETMPRAGSYMLKKDIGLMLAHLGLRQGYKVLDAGAGSGGLAIYLGNAVGQGGSIVTYERSQEFAATARANILKAGLGEIVKLVERDVMRGFDQSHRTVDIVTLDMGGSWELLNEVKRVLRTGGRTGIFTPYIEHSKKVHEGLLERGFIEVVTVESIVREMDFKDVGSRPKTSRVGHSGYLTFGRKV